MTSVQYKSSTYSVFCAASHIRCKIFFEQLWHDVVAFQIWEGDEDNDFECISILSNHTQDVKKVLFHPQHNNILFSCGYDDTIRVYEEDPDKDDW